LAGLRSAIAVRSSAKRRLRYAIIDAQQRVVFGDSYLAPFASTTTAGVQLLSQQNGEDATDNILVAVRSLSGDLRLVVADNLDSIEDIEDVILNGVVVALVLAVAIGLGAGALLGRSILHRVENVTRTAEAITNGDLSQRIALTGSGDDFDRLAATLNTMLDRISDLLENLRQVSNDIAHDLRTPLAHLRQRLEDAKSHAGSINDYRQAVDDAIEDADGLLNTFSALLRIAQVEAGTQRASVCSVDLSDVMQTVAEAYAPDIEDSGRSLQADIPVGVTITGDRELLTQLFANLLANALRHTPRGTHIAIRLRENHSAVVAEVSDDGPGIPLEEHTRVFRRFYRLERSRTTPGNGLGLSLVGAVANLHHATIDLLDKKPGLIVLIRFPKIMS
jgi:signal transduction histidine kinase